MSMVLKALENGNFWVNVASIVVGIFFAVFTTPGSCCWDYVIASVVLLGYLFVLAEMYSSGKSR
jgi:hypothetical protein